MVRIFLQGEPMKTRRVVTIAVGMAVLAGSALAGGERTNIQGMGMARTFVASSRGLDAVGVNPANLGAPDDGSVTIGLIPFGLHVGTDFMNYGMYKEYFTGEETSDGRVGRLLTNADKQTILESFTNGVGHISADVEARPVGISVSVPEIGTFAVTMTEYVSVNFSISQDYARFLLYGNPPGTSYDFSSTSAYASWLREYALSYGTMLPAPDFMKTLSAGVAVKMVHGYGYYDIDRFNTRFTTGADGILQGSMDNRARMAGIDPIRGVEGASYQPFPAPAGTGWGLDFGVASDITDYLRAGLSVTDIGSVEWTRNLEQAVASSAVTIDNPMDESQRDSLENAVKGDRMACNGFITSLPTTFRVGAAVSLNKLPGMKRILFGEWMFACDYNLGLVEGAGAARVGRFSMGLEFKPWGFLPLRTGVSFLGSEHYNLALGFGFHFGVFDMDFASEHLNFLLSEESLAHGSVAMGMRIRI
jgi:hypothetical protein